MKLLLDQNISYRVAKNFELPDLQFVHVNEVRLQNKPDLEIWEFAKRNDFTIVTFDGDFYELQTLNGFPPKIIWLRFGNTTRDQLSTILKIHIVTIKRFIKSEIGCLELY